MEYSLPGVRIPGHRTAGFRYVVGLARVDQGANDVAVREDEVGVVDEVAGLLIGSLHAEHQASTTQHLLKAQYIFVLIFRLEVGRGIVLDIAWDAVLAIRRVIARPRHTRSQRHRNRGQPGRNTIRADARVGVGDLAVDRAKCGVARSQTRWQRKVVTPGITEDLEGAVAKHIPAEAKARRPLRAGFPHVGHAARTKVGKLVIAHAEVQK